MKNYRRRNEFLLREQDESGDAPKGDYTPPKERILTLPDVSDTMTETNASLDQLVDRYLLQYEKEAVPINREPDVTGPKPIGENKRQSLGRKGRLFSLLFEQDAPPPDPAPDAGSPAPNLGGGGDDSSGGDTDTGTEPGAETPTAPVPKINIRNFAEGVARLVNNYKTLISPETVILNRAMFYISKNYSARLAKEMMSILQRDFDLTPKTLGQKEAEIPAAPRAGGSGPDNGGGAPSGGGGGGS